MTILSVADRERIRSGVRVHNPDAPPDFIRLAEIHVAAYEVLRQTLGTEWCDKVVKPLSQKATRDFSRRDLASPNDRLAHVDRVIFLAEYLASLASVPNFEAKVVDLRTKGLEETFYELRVAYSLHKRGRLAKFVAPSGVKGQDFDLEACLHPQIVSVEVKCLTGEPSYSANRLANRLKKAATQLSPSGPGAIFVMLPSPWIATDTFAEDTRRAVASIFRNRSRTKCYLLPLGGVVRRATLCKVPQGSFCN